MIVPLYFPAYVIWHYTAGLWAAFGVAGNLIRFTAHFFSIGLLFKTLFSPWRRLGEQYSSGLHPNEWLATLTVNILMRVVGAVIRLFLIVFGLVAVVIVTVAVGVAILVWILWPVLILTSIVGGLFLLFSFS